MAIVNSSLPSELFYPVTPSDSTTIDITRAVIVAVAGNLSVRRIDDVDVTMPLPAGMFPMRVKRINATGTTATGISVLV